VLFKADDCRWSSCRSPQTAWVITNSFNFERWIYIAVYDVPHLAPYPQSLLLQYDSERLILPKKFQNGYVRMFFFSKDMIMQFVFPLPFQKSHIHWRWIMELACYTITSFIHGSLDITKWFLMLKVSFDLYILLSARAVSDLSHKMFEYQLFWSLDNAVFCKWAHKPAYSINGQFFCEAYRGRWY